MLPKQQKIVYKVMKKTLNALIIFLLFLRAANIFASPLHIDYYGVVSQSSDANMLKMAQDIFFTQLKSMADITVDDKRPDPSKASAEIPEIFPIPAHVAFYAEISEIQNEAVSQKSWNCKFNAVSSETGRGQSKTEVYDSYYKILASAKMSIDALLASFKGQSEEQVFADTRSLQASITGSGTNVESLAGTWNGEPYTDKIIILRSGKGFVIFQNGATMNIQLIVRGGTNNGLIADLEIRQTGKSNASFFPNLPRETALKIAEKATPIIWKFKLSGSGKLEGTKHSPVQNGDSISEDTVSVTWTRK